MRRILLAGLFHEGNSFSTLITNRKNFSVTTGQAVIEKAKTSGAAMGGAYRFVAGEDVQLVPVITAIAPPGGPVADGAYFEFRQSICDAAAREQVDGLYIDLHGAMLTETIDDVEGDLLAHLRDVVGPDVPIAVSLDLHAYMTPKMLEATPLIVACKENPHSDYHLAGELAAKLLLQKLDDAIAPVAAAVWLPFIFGSQMETARGPLARLHAHRRELLQAHPALLDISIYNATSFMDVPESGQCITAIADGDVDVAADTVEQLAQELWDARAEFVPDLPELDEVLAKAGKGRKKPFVLGDQGDRVLAGTPGDGTFIMREILEKWPDVRAVVPVTDPDAVAKAKAAGLGAVLNIGVGGRLSLNEQPVVRDWAVTGLGDGHFVQQGPFLANEAAELGDTATLKSGNLTLLVTSIPGFTQDPQAFRSQGIEPADFDVVVCKSGYHYKLAFPDIGNCLSVNTPGISNYRPGFLTYRKLRNVYPEDLQAEPDFKAKIFNS